MTHDTTHDAALFTDRPSSCTAVLEAGLLNGESTTDYDAMMIQS